MCAAMRAMPNTFLAPAGVRAWPPRAGVRLLGELPLDARIREDADGGRPTVAAEPGSRRAQLYFEMARRTGAALAPPRRDRSIVFSEHRRRTVLKGAAQVNQG